MLKSQKAYRVGMPSFESSYFFISTRFSGQRRVVSVVCKLSLWPPCGTPAFSGGTDSSPLAMTAARYGKNWTAYYARLAFQPVLELETAKKLPRSAAFPYRFWMSMYWPAPTWRGIRKIAAIIVKKDLQPDSETGGGWGSAGHRRHQCLR